MARLTAEFWVHAYLNRLRLAAKEEDDDVNAEWMHALEPA